MITAIVPLVGWVLTAACVYLRARSRLSWREALLVSATICAVWLVLGTELLSLVYALHFWAVFLWWALPLPVLALLAIKWRGRRALLPRFPRLGWFDCSLLAAIVIVLGWAWCQAWFSPPNNVDSQEYHLQRQVFWKQQASVEHFPTSNLRQVVMPPLTEFAGVTLMILTSGDRYHNLVQWFAFLLSLFAVSLTTRRFNRSPTAQLLAVAWTATIPLAFLQASTTKNDVAVMMWICLLAYWILLFDSRSRLRWPHVALVAVAFGALALTKGTGVIFGLPLAVLAAAFLLRRHPRLAVPALTGIAIMALAINAGHFARNYRAFGSVAPDHKGIHEGGTVGNEDRSVGAITSNVLRTLGSHCVLPSERFNERMTQLMRDVHARLGREIDDPRTTWLPGGRFRPYTFSQADEDKAAAPAHLLLGLLLPVTLIFAWRDVPWRAVLPLVLVFIAGLILFALLLKWQNWHVRLIIALPALLAPVFAWSFGTRRLRYAAPVAVLLPLVTLLPSLNAIPRPLLGPKNIFDADPLALRCYLQPKWPAEYRELVARVVPIKPRTVGFFTGAGSPDYPMQKLLLDQLSPDPTFMAFNATLQIAGRPEPDPDMLLVARSNVKRIQHTSTGTWYFAEAKVGRYTLFRPEKAAPVVTRSAPPRTSE